MNARARKPLILRVDSSDRFAGEFESKGFPFPDGRYTFFEPDRSRISFQIVVEELLHSDGPVFSVFILLESVRFSVIVQHPDRPT